MLCVVVFVVCGQALQEATVRIGRLKRDICGYLSSKAEDTRRAKIQAQLQAEREAEERARRNMVDDPLLGTGPLKKRAQFAYKPSIVGLSKEKGVAAGKIRKPPPGLRANNVTSAIQLQRQKMADEAEQSSTAAIKAKEVAAASNRLTQLIGSALVGEGMRGKHAVNQSFHHGIQLAKATERASKEKSVSAEVQLCCWCIV